MVNKDKLIASFEEIIGWPYASPGSNDQRGIDCSGAFVRAYRAQGAGIYHGSNTIYRRHLGLSGPIHGISSLAPGMAVFKNRQDGREPAQYRNDGIGNMYHIGLVASAKPLRIIHATTPVAKVDTTLGNWSHFGCLKAVDYEGQGSKPEDESRHTIKKGAKGPWVAQMQGLLIRSGYDLSAYGGADGDFGSGTERVLKVFQQFNLLTADGICGPKTWAALLASGGAEEQILYTVTIRALRETEAAGLIAKYGGTMEKERG